jgi:hypothetical protein
MEFKQLTLRHLENKTLLRYRRSLLSGGIGFVVTHFGKVQGFILPIATIQKLEFESTKEMTFGLAAAADRHLFDYKVDCVYLKFRGRAIAAIVDPKFQCYIDFPAIGDPDQVLYARP